MGRRLIVWSLLWLGLGLGVAGCGAKGDLYLPSQGAAAAEQNAN